MTVTKTSILQIGSTSPASGTAPLTTTASTDGSGVGGGGLKSTTLSNSIMPSSSFTTTASTVTPTSTSTVAPTSKSSSGGLSVGAKVGIAIGALAIAFILLLLALFFLRRKHRSRRQTNLVEYKSAPEQAMLTRDMHTDSFQSRNNILAEKEEIASFTTPLHNQNGSGNGGPVLAAVPRRKPIDSNAPVSQPTSSSGANPNISRGLSTMSRVSEPNTARSVDAYQDHPTSHSGGNGGTSVPFLREEGMTPEEVARLEEEERRIDAAIAEAERREGR
jgi:hypothetical protein